MLFRVVYRSLIGGVCVEFHPSVEVQSVYISAPADMAA